MVYLKPINSAYQAIHSNHVRWAEKNYSNYNLYTIWTHVT